MAYIVKVKKPNAQPIPEDKFDVEPDEQEPEDSSKPTEPYTEVIYGAHAEDGPWSVADLYRRSAGNRRVMFLELMAWAIISIEGFESREGFAQFRAGATRLARAGMVRHPWNGATEREPFLRHVESLAKAFTADWPVQYTARRHQPGSS
jgi:hypothetical protein